MPRLPDEPTMSDNTLLVSVEDLINRALGPPDVNKVNFKLVQTILHILARQQRVLEQRVEIRVTELKPPRSKTKREVSDTTATSSSKSPRPTRPPRSPDKTRMTAIKEVDAKKEKDKPDTEAQKEKERAQKEAAKETQIEKERAEKAALKEKEKFEKLTIKEQEKAEKLAMKEKEKAEKAALKEKEKAEKSSMKEKEKAEKAALKEKEELERAKQKEKERYDKMSQKEREKAEKMAQKEKEKFEKMTEKEKEKALKEAERAAMKAEREAEKERERAEKEKLKAEKHLEKTEKKVKKEREASPTPSKKAVTVTISETQRDKEKVLVESRQRANIEVVTQSQFALLEAAVRELRDVAVPKPLSMPDNAKLRSDLAKGSASLTDTMQAMQVNARVNAAENAIGRMTDLLTKLAASGAMPEDLASKVEDVRIEPVQSVEVKEFDLGVKSRPSVAARKSVAIEPKSQASMTPRPSSVATPRPSALAQSRISSAGKQSIISMMPGVTQDEMHEALNKLKDDLTKNLSGMTTRAVNAAESALHMAKTVSEKLDVALKLDTRISTLYSLVGDYAEQLSGFDAGLTTQMQSFQEQMMQMRGDLKSGLVQLENVNNNAETAAVMELTERYQDLVTELDSTLLAHAALSSFQNDLGNELHSLVETVEMLREQKCDRDEVLDGLRDKADSSRLAGLLSERQFAGARADLERRLSVCHDKFGRQDAVWTTAVKDLSKITDNKAEIVDLLSARDEAQAALRDLHERLKILAAVLGEPQAALMTRALSAGGVCGACLVPAHMRPRDDAAGAPARLPALRPPPETPAQLPCLRDWLPPVPDDRHACHRWCGGSHTLLAEATLRTRALGVEPGVAQATPTSRYTGYGSDGRLYMLEEELQPCLECKQPDSAPAPDGGGDHEPRRATVGLE